MSLYLLFSCEAVFAFLASDILTIWPNTTLAVEQTTAEQTFPCFVSQNTLHYEVSSPSVMRVYSLSGQQLLAQQIFGKGTLEIPYSGIVVVRLDNNTIHAARTYKL